METGDDYFSIDFWRGLIDENSLFDIAKMLDIAAIYGSGNNAMVKNMIGGLLETAPKLLEEFKESFDMMITVFKRIFRDALRTDQMLKGDAILQKTKSEQAHIIGLLLQDMVEILTNFQLITQHFGDSVLDAVSNTTFMVCLTNAYCLVRKIRKHWLK